MSAEMSNGLLPVEPLTHAEPTAIGEIELARGCVPRFNEPDRLGACDDQVLLVRLHGEPLGFVYVRSPPEPAQPADMARAVWGAVRDPLLAHLDRLQCAAPPTAAEDLVAGFPDACPRSAPRRPPGRAAVIVATVGRVDVLRRAITSLGALKCDDYEIVVVDNRPREGSTRELVTELAETMPVRYVAEPRAGLAVARNTGVAAAADADYVAFTDDDVIVDPGWLAWLLAPFEDAQVGSTTGLVMPFDLASSTAKRFELYAGFGKGVRSETYDLTEHRADDRLFYPFWGGMFGSGNSMAFRRTFLEQIRGFDPALGAGTPSGGGEDLAAFTDVILAGGRLVYEPRSICWHEHRADADALTRQVYNYGIGFTASLWRYLVSDPAFLVAVARSVPVIVRSVARRRHEVAQSTLPADLLARERRGWLLGPWEYERGRHYARRSGHLPAPRDRSGHA